MKRDGVKHGKFRPILAMVFAEGLFVHDAKSAFEKAVAALDAVGIGIKAAGPAGLTQKLVFTGRKRPCECCEDLDTVRRECYTIVLQEPLHLTRAELHKLGCPTWTLVRERDTLRRVPLEETRIR